MPTLFDDHEEFNEWFSKDIESHAENKSNIDKSEYLKAVYVISEALIFYRMATQSLNISR